MDGMKKAEGLVLSFLLESCCRNGLISRKEADVVNRKIILEDMERMDRHDETDRAA